MSRRSPALGEGPRALGDHLWTAFDVGRRARRRGAPELVDLLAGGRRRGFCESPDSLYGVGFIELGPGLAYRLEMPASPAFYAVVSFHSRRGQTQLELTEAEPGAGLGSQAVELAHGACAPRGLDTAPYSGLTQVMVRQYYHRGRASAPPAMPRLVCVTAGAEGRRRPRPPAPLVAGGRFLLWRLKPLLGIKALQARLGRRLPTNRFLSYEELVALWRGGRQVVDRLGITSFRYAVAVFDLAPGETLAIDYRPGGSRYFAFSLNNRWMQGLRGPDGPAYLGSGDLAPGADGGYRITVGAVRPPGGAPHLDTGGRRRGLIHFREILPAAEPERPGCRLLGGAKATGRTAAASREVTA